MLAQNFKTAADLGIGEAEINALIKVLGMLEREEITQQHFDMSVTWNDCGSVGCLLGWARNIAKDQSLFAPCFGVDGGYGLEPLRDLFLFVPSKGWEVIPEGIRRSDITPANTAIALRSYLSTGEANWAEVFAA